jgi:hypothetical protein
VELTTSVRSGEYDDARCGHRYVLSGGVFTTLTVPGASFTTAGNINDAQMVMGVYTDASGTTHGYLASPVPEVATLPLCGIVVVRLGTVAWRRQRRQRPTLAKA